MEFSRRNPRLLPLLFETEVTENENKNDLDQDIPKTHIYLNTNSNPMILFIMSIVLGAFILIIKTSFLSPPIQKKNIHYYPLYNSKANLSSVTIQYSAEKLTKKYSFFGISAQFISLSYSLANHFFNFSLFTTANFNQRNKPPSIVNETQSFSISFRSSNRSTNIPIFFQNPISAIHSAYFNFNFTNFLNMYQPSIKSIQIDGVLLTSFHFNPYSVTSLFLSRSFVSILNGFILTLLVFNDTFHHPSFISKLLNFLSLSGTLFLNPLSLLFPHTIIIYIFDHIFRASFNIIFRFFLLIQLYCLYKCISHPSSHDLMIFKIAFAVYFLFDVISGYFSEYQKLKTPFDNALKLFYSVNPNSAIPRLSFWFQFYICIFHFCYLISGIFYCYKCINIVLNTPNLRRFILVCISFILHSLLAINICFSYRVDSFLSEVLSNNINAILAISCIFLLQNKNIINYKSMSDIIEPPQTLTVDVDDTFQQDVVD